MQVVSLKILENDKNLVWENGFLIHNDLFNSWLDLMNYESWLEAATGIIINT